MFVLLSNSLIGYFTGYLCRDRPRESDGKGAHPLYEHSFMNTTSDLLNVQRLPYFRLLVSLGAVSDMKCDKNGVYSPMVEEMHGISQTTTGAWLQAENLLQAQTMEVRLNERNILLMADAVSLVVSIAVEFGKVGFTGEPQAVKYAGSEKVLMCG